MFFTILIFIVILTILILVHELGHFIAAKHSQAKVEEFGIGFPPRLFGIKKGETLYSLNLLPIGGFVKIYGEDGAQPHEKKADPRSFASKPIMTRVSIIAAGVLMNMVLAILLFSAAHMIGLPRALDETSDVQRVKNISVRIVGIAEHSPAAEADLRIGDVIIGLKAEADEVSGVQKIESVQQFTDQHLGEKIVMSIRRGSANLEKTVVPRVSPPEREGAIGIAMLRTGEVSYPVYIAPLKGIESTFFLTVDTVNAFAVIVADFVKTGALKEELAGPVGIAVITGQVQQLGFIFLLQFIALISVNLAVINILPFPALDGGRLLFLAIEKIKGSPLSQKYEKMAHTIGFALLIFLMILVTFRDIVRFL